MSLFRIVKYSSLLFFLGKYKTKLFRVVSVLLFALMTSLLYQDVVDYLELQHPETVIYALIGKIIIVYGSLIFVLLQFRPEPDDTPKEKPDTVDNPEQLPTPESTAANDRFAELADVTKKDALRSRYDGLIDRE